MSFNRKRNLADSVLDTLDQERLAIWQAHPDWPEERRLGLWSRRKAEIASYLVTDDSTPRYLRTELGGPTVGLVHSTGGEGLVRPPNLARSGPD